MFVLDPGDAGRTASRWGELIARSETGMLFALEVAVAVGTILWVRPANASALVPWLEVEVIGCKSTPAGWEIAGRFLRLSEGLGRGR
jgi:hypothetical protein